MFIGLFLVDKQPCFQEALEATWGVWVFSPQRTRCWGRSCSHGAVRRRWEVLVHFGN